MNVPQLAARPPAGPTQTIGGIGASRSAETISLVASRLPPGVSSWMTTAGAPSWAAWAMPSLRYAANTLSTTPVAGRTGTTGPAPRAGPARPTVIERTPTSVSPPARRRRLSRTTRTSRQPYPHYAAPEGQANGRTAQQIFVRALGRSLFN